MNTQNHPKSTPWLSDFSDPVRIFTVIVVAEMMVLVYSLSFLSFDFSYLNRLAVLSLLAQLIAISVILLLTLMRPFFNRLPVLLGLMLLLLLTVLLAATYTVLLGWIDQALMFDLISDNRLTALKISVATGMTLLALLRYFFVQDQWSRQIEALAQAQMNALQARIKPHFLYNSLNSIASLIPLDQAAAEQAVLNLSGLFRKAFTHTEQSQTPLHQELEWINQYLAIEKLRLMDRLDHRLTVDEGLEYEMVPLLSIQPLVENAVIHGIAHLTEGGTIDIQVRRTEQGFKVQVTNPYRPGSVQSGSQTGLDNIRQRLALTYGNQVNMQVDAGELFTASWEVNT
ncbi:sensor histidine kinase [Marinicella meishanensis]|uniref:sensor histidine kinase n=1 Tax=Marinicella meishanensis TaxID=2873263 RepID=UPI001CBC2626|nr:histidine kinase [Marinicella sp. NBU2979]